VSTLRAGEYDVYDDRAYRTPGHYVYRVRGVTAAGAPLSDWSEEGSFDVAGNTPIAALGDSITHGGGAITLPPSYTLYDWETYCAVPVKNLGRSGDTTADLLARFDSDVLPFAPPARCAPTGRTRWARLCPNAAIPAKARSCG